MFQPQKPNLNTKPVVAIPIPRNYFEREPLWGNAGGYRAVNEIMAAVSEAGGIPQLLFPGDEKVAFDALILPGGGDLDPKFYGQDAQEEVVDTDPELDHFQLTLAQAALQNGTPLLGICRGMQVMNVATGGSLVQHLESSDHHFPEQARQNPDLRGLPVHPVSLVKESQLSTMLEAEFIDVNSLHHQAVDRLGAGLKAVAYSPDGVVEAVEGEHGYQLGVQFHPEDLVRHDGRFSGLFRGLVQAAGKRQAV